MVNQPEQPDRSKQLKVWTLMTATLAVGALLAFGRWASDDPIAMRFGPIAWQAFPAGWILTIEYGVILLMVVLVIRADRVDALLSSKDTLTWLGGIGLFTAALYHNPGFRTGVVWGGSVNGYGTVTEFVRRASFDSVPRLLSAWPMVYGLIAATTSFVAIMAWSRRPLRWRWILHALFLVIVTVAWFTLVIWPWNQENESRWLAGSIVVLPALVVVLLMVHDPERRIAWMNLIASGWLATALFPQFDVGRVVLPMSEALARMDHGYRILVLGDLLVLVGSLVALIGNIDRDHAAKSAP
jgi:hypothetical protein